MNRMTKSSSFLNQGGLLNDVVVCLEISYLDSATDYQECLPRRTRIAQRGLRFAWNREKAVQFGTCAGVALVVLTLLTLSWFFG